MTIETDNAQFGLPYDASEAPSPAVDAIATLQDAMEERARRIYRVLGQRLRAARRVRQLSQARVARGLGISAQQLQKYEAGSNRLPLSSLLQICEILGIDAPVLLSGLPTGPGDSRTLEMPTAADPKLKLLVTSSHLAGLARDFSLVADVRLATCACDALEALLLADGRDPDVTVHRSESGDLMAVVVTLAKAKQSRRGRTRRGVASDAPEHQA